MDPATVEMAVAEAHRRGWALVLAATARVTRDLDLAEECVQDAYASALVTWASDGIPRNPQAWLTTTARRRAIDAVRRERVLRSKLLVEPIRPEVEPADQGPDSVPDERSSTPKRRPTTRPTGPRS